MQKRDVLRWLAVYGSGGRDKKKSLESLMVMNGSRQLLAVPFVGKDVPSQASEFAHPDVLIGLRFVLCVGMRRCGFCMCKLIWQVNLLPINPFSYSHFPFPVFLPTAMKDYDQET